jgi:hypothetical protein
MEPKDIRKLRANMIKAKSLEILSGKLPSY